MTINLSMPVNHELRPRISVVGVGGAGTNAVNNMITAHLEGVEFLACNTDAQSLAQSLTERRIQLGTSITQGLGAGARPEIGRAAAEEAVEELLDHLQGSHMVFITAGMGGGTGTGAAPVIARAVREQGILTVGVVTKPFHFEGAHRMRVADACKTAQRSGRLSSAGRAASLLRWGNRVYRLSGDTDLVRCGGPAHGIAGQRAAGWRADADALLSGGDEPRPSHG